MVTVLSGIAKFEADMIKERQIQMEGIALAMIISIFHLCSFLIRILLL